MDQIRNKAFIKTDGTVTCCGFNVENTALIVEKVHGHVMGTTEVLHRNKTLCPKCGKELFKVQRGSRNGVGFTDYEGMMVKKWKSHVDYSKHSSFYFEGKYNNVYRKCNLDALIYNYKTGMLYHMSKNQVPKKTKVLVCFNNVYQPSKKHNQFITKCLELRALELFPEVDLISIMCNYYGVEDTGRADDIIDFLFSGLPSNAQLISYTFFNIMKNPKFAWLPANDYGRMSSFGRKWTNATTPIETLHAVFGKIGKVFRKYLLSNSISPTESNAFNANSYFIPNFHTMMHIFTPDLLRDMLKDIDWNTRLFHSHNMLTGFGNAGSRKAIFKDARVFVERIGERRLLNHVANDFNLRTKQGLHNETLSLLVDSIMSWRNINEVLPDFDIKRQNNLKNLHDYMAKESRKVKTRNQTIEYTEDELKKCNIITPWFEFRLANDTHELVDIGNDMDMCVGGYGYSAVLKNLYIINVFKENKPIICMEVGPNLSTLMQAKMYQNKRVSSDAGLTRLILGYCRKRGIVAKCFDVTGQMLVDDIYNLQPAAIAPVPEIVAIPMAEARERGFIF